MNALRGRAGRLAMIGALFGMVAGLAAPHLGDVTAGSVDTDPTETTIPADPTGGPETSGVAVEPTATTEVEPTATTEVEDTAPESTIDDTDTTEAVVESTTPEPTGPFPTVEPEPKPDAEAPTPTEPDGTVGPAGPGDTYGVTVVAVCVGGTTPVVDFTSTSTADILVTVGGEPNWSTVLAPSANAQGTWPTDERGNPSTSAKWDARSVDPDGWTDVGIVDLPADCPPPPNTPSAPENFSTTPSNGSVALSWLPPSWDGGSAITDYVVEYNAYPVDDAWTTVDDGGATSALTIGGLENCVTYLFRVRADNLNGQGEWIDGKDTPASVPCAPPTPSATNVNGQIVLEWSEPPHGSNPVTDYVIEYDAHPVDGVWTIVDDGVNANPSFIVSGLALGTRYSFHVAAINGLGLGDFSAVVEAVPAVVPTAPRTLTAVPTNVSGQVRLTWLSPLSNGGSSIDIFRLQRSPNGTTGWTTISDVAGTNTTVLVNGLTNGVRFYFRALAHNSVGFSPPSNVANAIPRTVPTAPRSLTATATGVSGQIRLAWLAPLSNGGSALTDYIIQRSPNGTSGWTTINDGVNASTAYTVSGLVNGARYYFRVFARNAAGNSPPSNLANAIPRYVLTAPRSLTATPTNQSGQIRLAWLVPLSNGGAAISDYIIQRSPNGSTGWTTITDGVNVNTAHTVTGLSNGVRYYFRVFAKTSRATSPSSNIANAVPRVVPTAPRSLVAAPTNLSGQIRLAWLAPSSSGGSAVTDYVIQRSTNGTYGWVTINDGVSATTSRIVPGLTNGVRYYFRVFARNAAGFSPPSNIANAIPRAVPTAPRSLAAAPTNLSGQIRLTWLAPASSGGSAVTDYIIQRSPNGTTSWTTVVDGVSTATAYTVTGLTNGARYYFRVVARNAVGFSPASAVVNAIPRTVPGTPSFVQVEAFSWGFELEWGNPVSTGGSPITGFLIQAFDGEVWFNLFTAQPTTRILTIDAPGEGCGAFRIATLNAAGRSAFLGPVVDCWP